MDFKFIDEQLQRLNYEWFLKKKEFFIDEPLYRKNLDKVNETFISTTSFFNCEEFVEEEKEIIIDVGLAEYCWNSYFEGSKLKTILSDEQLFKTLAPPVDGNEISAKVIERLKLDTEPYSDAIATSQYLTIAKKQISNTISTLSSKHDDISYNDALKLFQKNTDDAINKKFVHIEKQVQLRIANNDYRVTLTLEKCHELADIKVNGKRFITESEPIDRGSALFCLLNDNSEVPKGLKIRVEDLVNNDVYYILTKLSEITKGQFTPAGIEHKQILYLKNGKQFERRLYDNFKSQKINAYPIQKQEEIDQQLRHIF